MERYIGKTIQGVYACYAVTPATEKILRQISEEIKNVMLDIPQEEKPNMSIPSSYHLTVDYRGEVKDILQYVEEMQSRKKSGSIVPLSRLDYRQSFANHNIISHIKPHRNVELPFRFVKETNPHVTLLEIENDESGKFFMRFVLALDEIAMIWRHTYLALPKGSALEVDTSKIQIWGKVDGTKQLIVEI